MQLHIYFIFQYLTFFFNFLVICFFNFSVSLISYNLNFVWPVKFVLSFVSMELLSSTFKIFQNYTIIYLKSVGENKLVQSIKLLPANIKSINPKQKRPHIHYWIVWLYSKYGSFYVFMLNKFFNFFRNMFNFKSN